MIKKIDDYIIKFNYKKKKKKKKNSAKPTNWGNQGYLAKLANQIIDSTKFNNLVLFKIIFYLTNCFF